METKAPPSEQFIYAVREFAVDGPAEPSSLLAVVPRHPYRSGMTVLLRGERLHGFQRC
ncbi:hypothetical protein ACWCQM_15410 [Streptomyces sp. NPDC002125]